MKFSIVALFLFTSFAGFAAPIQPGATAPCVSLDQVDKAGNKSTQSTCASSPAGKKIVLEFFATWCRYCVSNLPKFEELAKKHNAVADFRILGLDDQPEPLEQYFAPRAMEGYAVAFDMQAASADAFGVEGIPSLYVIGADGKVVLFHEGTIETEAEMQAVEDAITR